MFLSVCGRETDFFVTGVHMGTENTQSMSVCVCVLLLPSWLLFQCKHCVCRGVQVFLSGESEMN